MGKSLEEFSTGSLICNRVALRRGKTENQAAGEVSVARVVVGLLANMVVSIYLLIKTKYLMRRIRNK